MSVAICCNTCVLFTDEGTAAAGRDDGRPTLLRGAGHRVRIRRARGGGRGGFPRPRRGRPSRAAVRVRERRATRTPGLPAPGARGRAAVGREHVRGGGGQRASGLLGVRARPRVSVRRGGTGAWKFGAEPGGPAVGRPVERRRRHVRVRRRGVADVRRVLAVSES